MRALEQVLVRTLLQTEFKAMRRRGLPYSRTQANGVQPDLLALLEAIAGRDVERATRARRAYHEHQRAVFVADP